MLYVYTGKVVFKIHQILISNSRRQAYATFAQRANAPHMNNK